jgi:thiopeptide-type bacteriocin biosynthesis protein
VAKNIIAGVERQNGRGKCSALFKTSNTQTEVCTRELERYGANTIKYSEDIFHIDSESVLEMLALIEEDNQEEIRWLFALRSLHELFTAFNYGMEETIEILKHVKTNLFMEHGGSKELKRELDDKFRKSHKQMEEILDEQRYAIGTAGFAEILKVKRKKLKPIVDKVLALHREGKMLVSLESFVTSHAHMMINRIFHTRQLTHEMVLYELLYRYYRSSQARGKMKK